MPKSLLFFTGLIFTAVAVLHVLRLAYGWVALIGGFSVPMWASVAGAVIAALLSALYFWYASR